MTLKNKLLLVSGIAACAAAAVLVNYALAGNRHVQYTDDAYVTADFSVIAPKISGLIDQVEVDDNEPVHTDQELAHIDARDYRAAFASAEAAYAAARADAENAQATLARQQPIIDEANAVVRSDDAALSFARANATRYRNLSSGGAGTVEQQQQSASQLAQAIANRDRDVAAAAAATRQVAVLQAAVDQAAANVKRTQAAQVQARLNLSYTRILAPIAGVVGMRGVRVGNYVSPGSPLLAVVPLGSSTYVLANFQETQLTNIHCGEHVQITVDSFPGQVLDGTVNSLAPASGVTFSPIPPDNATGNFTKVVQRIPLKITFDPGQPLLQRLRVGMSVEASVDTTNRAASASSLSVSDETKTDE